MSRTTFPIDAAQMAALFLEAVLYGIYLITFNQAVACIVSSARCPRAPPMHWPSLLVGLFLWTNATINLALGLLRQLQDYTSSSTPVVRSNLDWITVTKSVGVVLQVLVADAMLVYRCWKVYKKQKRIIIVPVILWLCALTANACFWVLNVTISLYPRSYSPRLISVIGCIFWAFSVPLNIYATSVIVFRIWRIDKEVFRADSSSSPPVILRFQRETSTKLQKAIKIIVESALIYTLVSLSVLVTKATGSNMMYLTTAADIMVVGISYDMIVIRIHGERLKDLAYSQTNTPASTLKFEHEKESAPSMDFGLERVSKPCPTFKIGK